MARCTDVRSLASTPSSRLIIASTEPQSSLTVNNNLPTLREPHHLCSPVPLKLARVEYGTSAAPLRSHSDRITTNATAAGDLTVDSPGLT
jgi:hypothetical protein